MQGYAQEICRTWFFVGLRIEVDAPGVLAAIRPCQQQQQPGPTRRISDLKNTFYKKKKKSEILRF